MGLQYLQIARNQHSAAFMPINLGGTHMHPRNSPDQRQAELSYIQEIKSIITVIVLLYL